MSAPNAYGLAVWDWAVRYKAALAGTSDTGGTTPTPPTEPTIPPLPGVEVTEDPGPLPELVGEPVVALVLRREVRDADDEQ